GFKSVCKLVHLSHIFRSRRDCARQPRVARNELPWVCSHVFESSLKGLSPRFLRDRDISQQFRNPFRVVASIGTSSQGSSFLATLGFGTESLRNSAFI